MSQEWWEGHPDLFPPEPELEPLHARNYSVRAWKLSDDAFLLRGAVMDLKPGAGVKDRFEALGGHDDGGPMTIHHMVVDLTIGFPQLAITDANVVFESFPQPGCPGITPHYRELIGLSIARGFTHEVRQRFGGPRGCTHTTALLQAMGPVAVQCIFSMRRGGVGSADATPAGAPGRPSFMKDTCHVWAEDGALWQRMTEGEPPPMQLPLQRRLRAAGLDPDNIQLWS